jgi:hypothetical protein
MGAAPSASPRLFFLGSRFAAVGARRNIGGDFGNAAFTMTDESAPSGLVGRAPAPPGAFAGGCLSVRLSPV